MPLTRTIRRKMVAGLALVLAMLIALSLGGISGMISYRNVVHDLDFSINQAPRKADLAAAVGLLFEPLLVNPPVNAQARRYQQLQFDEQLKAARQEITEFHRKLDRLPPSEAVLARRPVTEAILQEIDVRLDRLERSQALLANPDVATRAVTVQSMFYEVASLQTLAKQVPDHQDGLNATLQRARGDYRSRFQLIAATTAIVIVLFFGLGYYGYVWIFAPLRKLHQGARRVAQGDFDYRLQLAGNDEMAELAESFDKMTARFQEIAQDLDRQVRERSKQLVRSERLAGIGFLAAGVAHEINNPLSAIAMAAESLEGRFAAPLRKGGTGGSGSLSVFGPPPAPPCKGGEHDGEIAAPNPSSACDGEAEIVRQYLGMIQREAFRCQQITAKLLDFARGQGAVRGRNDLTTIVAEVLEMVRHMGKYRDRQIEFDRTEPCHAEVNGPEIKQVVLNLVANALDSMESGRTLRIDVVEQTDHVALLFEDEGCGMTAETIENLFEPFFTQRKDGKGTGLGLSISHRIVCDHGGTIEATSEGPGRGSTFRVHLPRRAARAAAA